MKLLIFILLFLPSISFAYMMMPIDSVYDGDTIKTSFNTKRLPEPLNKVSIRIRGIDTPELPAKSYLITGKLGRAKCIQEAELALRAKEFVTLMSIGFNKMKVTDFKWGKYGGRIVGNVSIGGTDIASALIAEGLAIQYTGGKKTKNWCE